jgi:hypothetical protein
MLGWFRKRKSDDSTAEEGAAGPGPDPPALAIQRAHWSPDPAEQALLRSRHPASLCWADWLRLHHLNCIEYLWKGGEQAVWRRDDEVDAPDNESLALARCGETARLLLAPESPYRARHCEFRSEESGGPGAAVRGWTRNASLTHLGCLEVIRLDGQNDPREIAFVPFDDLRAVVFASPALFRAARLFYDEGRVDEIVLVPLLYAWT